MKINAKKFFLTKKSLYLCAGNDAKTKTNIMTYLQATNEANKALDLSLEALNNGQLSEYVKLQKQVDYLNEVARALETE